MARVTKNSSRLIHRVEPLEVQVTPIHDVEGAGFDEQQVQHIDIVHLAVGDVDEGGDRASKIEQRVQLHCCFCRAKRRPREHRQAEIDSRGIERIHSIGQLHAEVLADVERAGLEDQPLGQLEVYAPVAQLVCVSQRRACDRRADAHMIELAGLSPQTDLDIAQALAVGQLRESHDAKLLGATETARPVITAVMIHDAMESLPWQEIWGAARIVETPG